MAADVVIFPRRPLGPEAIRHFRDEPGLVLVLPVMARERDLTPAQRLGRFLNSVLDADRT